MEGATQDNKKELRIILDSNKVQNYLQIQNVKIKEEVVSDDEPAEDLQPISQVYLQEYHQIKSEVVDSTTTLAGVKQHEDKQEDTKKLFSCSLCKKHNMSLAIFKSHLIQAHLLSKDEVLKYVPEFYQCKYCQRQFKTPSLRNIHEGSHTVPYKCDICCKSFGLKLTLKRHKLIHSSEPQFSCPHCDKKFRQKTYLKCHIKRVHSGVVHKCDQCEKKFKWRSNLLNHIRNHNNITHQSSWECDECGKGFKFKPNLKRHIIAVHLTLLKNYLCSHCSAKFKSNDNLTFHLKTIHNSGVLIESNNWSIKPRTYSKACNNVNAEVVSEPVGQIVKLQNQHIKEEILEDPEIQPISEVFLPEYQEENIKTEVKSPLESTMTVEQHEDKHKEPKNFYSCSLCKMEKMRVNYFKQHLIKAHHLNNEEILKYVPEFYQCKYCHCQFKTPSLLARHEGTHTLPFKCDKCDKKYSEKHHLIRHELSHSEPKFPCPHCDTTFRRKDNLKFHIERKHNVEVHKCDQCKKKFKWRSCLLQHIRNHHNITHQSCWECDECGKCFKYKPNLKKHILAVHLTLSKNYLCSYCSAKFKFNYSLKLHIKATHNRDVPIESKNWSIQPRTYSKACNNVNAEVVSEPVGQIVKLQNRHIKEEILEHPEVQPISEVYLPEYQEGNIKTEVKSPLESTMTVEQHEDKHEDTKKLFSCSLCKKNNMMLQYFKAHLTKTHHLSTEEILKYVPEFYQCKYCHRQFKTPSRLQKHENSHTLPFKCDICYKSYSLKSILKTHKLTHSEPHIPCPHCDKKFRRKVHVTNHIESVHSGVVHKCDQCEKKFKYRSSILYHIRNYHSISQQSSWKCDECGKCFKTKYYLRKHIVAAHKTMSKNYLCSYSYCRMKFKSNDYLTYHIKTIHNSSVLIESNNWSIKPRTYSKACKNVNAKGVSKPVGQLLKLQNQHIKEEILEDPEIQAISEVSLPEYQEGNVKTEVNSLLESTMSDDVEIETEITIDEMDLSAFKKEENTDN